MTAEELTQLIEGKEFMVLNHKQLFGKDTEFFNLTFKNGQIYKGISLYGKYQIIKERPYTYALTFPYSDADGKNIVMYLLEQPLNPIRFNVDGTDTKPTLILAEKEQ